VTNKILQKSSPTTLNDVVVDGYTKFTGTLLKLPPLKPRRSRRSRRRSRRRRLA
jgi:hypothetical protein